MSIVLAFSGGLDTSFCVPYLKETYEEPIYTITVNTGGITEQDEALLAEKSKELGAEKHFTIDGRNELFWNHLNYLVKGNVLRGNVYPLCVGPERVTQAQKIVDAARDLGARAIAHGSTGAGNDQVRFDVALRILASEMEILTPIRTLGYSRQQSADYLAARGFAIEDNVTTYSINRGLWGTTIGGKETLGSSLPLPEDAYPDTLAPSRCPDTPLNIKITFEKGIPTALDGNLLDPVGLIERLNELGGDHGVGRDNHVGDTILGIKGRVGFEAPAACILIKAHEELEKIILTKWQRYQKDQLAEFYGMLLHEGQHFDPVMRDIEQFIDSSQETVTGTVDVQLYKGHVRVLGCDSAFSMFDLRVASYGETNTLWDARDAQGFTQIYGVHAFLANKVRETQTSPR